MPRKLLELTCLKVAPADKKLRLIPRISLYDKKIKLTPQLAKEHAEVLRERLQ